MCWDVLFLSMVVVGINFCVVLWSIDYKVWDGFNFCLGFDIKMLVDDNIVFFQYDDDVVKIVY